MIQMANKAPDVKDGTETLDPQKPLSGLVPTSALDGIIPIDDSDPEDMMQNNL